jgi:threonine dehydratase
MRHMVGGRSELAGTSGCTASVPGAPGALMRFLASMHPGWNISLFHYRNQGADYGRILVGIQVPKDEQGLQAIPVDAWATPTSTRRDNPVYRLFLR